MWTRGIVGGILLLVGAVWIGQGTNAIHGSAMSGHGQWAVIGGVVIAIGFALLVWAWRIRKREMA
jgi:protein-S-isoprenylcysteine O-methyltransferase Ste14